MTQLTLGFNPEPLLLESSLILPARIMTPAVLQSRKFKQIMASIQAVGIIEPLTVGRQDPKTGLRMLLDGHLRLAALKQLGVESVPCLEAKDDESYTYNSRINRLSTVEEHLMIRRAIDSGVDPEQLAKALELKLDRVRKKVTLLDGICSEAVDLLRDQQFSADVADCLKKMKPARQIECVELMVGVDNLSISYAQALLAATPAALLVAGMKPKKIGGVSSEQMARMEREMGNLQSQFKSVEDTYGSDVLNFVIVRGYLNRLMANEDVVRYLSNVDQSIASEFLAIVRSGSLEA